MMRVSTDPARRTAAVFVAMFFMFAQAASALTVDLGETLGQEPVSLGVSRTDANRIELPETVINAFSSDASIDVRIIGRSVLVRAAEPAELIILTAKRRLTLLLSPQEGPSRTVIMRDPDAPSPAPGAERTEKEKPRALPWEKAITDLVLSLAGKGSPAGEIPGKEGKLQGPLLISLRAERASPPLLASLYVVRNSGSETAPLTESMFLAGPGTVAVGMESAELSPGESARVFVVTKKEPGQ